MSSRSLFSFFFLGGGGGCLFSLRCMNCSNHYQVNYIFRVSVCIPVIIGEINCMS